MTAQVEPVVDNPGILNSGLGIVEVEHPGNLFLGWSEFKQGYWSSPLGGLHDFRKAFWSRRTFGQFSCGGGALGHGHVSVLTASRRGI